MVKKETYIIRLLRLYGTLFKKQFGFYPTVSIPRFGKTMKELMVSHTEDQVSALIIIFFNWFGMDGGDQLEHDKLIKSTFNIHWFASCINQYEAYARNVLDIKMDDPECIDKFVKEHIHS